MSLDEIRPYIEAAWGIDTTYTPDEWTPENPARGQCAVTSVYLVRRFGGGLWKGFAVDLAWPRTDEYAQVRYYWALIGGYLVDLTEEQFVDGQFSVGEDATEADLISDPWMQERYDTFAKRVDEAIAKAKPVCRKCGGRMKPGKALEQNYSGIPDFIGSKEVCTVSPDGTAKMIDCMKCSACGWSTT